MGAGSLLYSALEERLHNQGIVNLLAGVAFCEAEDEYLTHDSFKFHTKMGYFKAGHLKMSARNSTAGMTFCGFKKRYNTAHEQKS